MATDGMDPFRFREGRTPLLVSMPHVGLHIPGDTATGMTKLALTLPDTDWHIDQLYDFLDDLGASVIAATHSRYVIDLNRPPDGASLYPGKATTELCPTVTFDGEPLYRDGAAPDETETVRRVTHYWKPYHDKLEAELAGGLALSASTPMIALAGGWSLGAAALLWLLPALRVMLSILYIRTRLRLDRGERTRIDDVLDAHVAVLVVLIGLAVGGWLPGLAAGAFAILGLRAMCELMRSGGATTAQRLGFIELSLGILFVMMTAVGYRGGF